MFLALRAFENLVLLERSVFVRLSNLISVYRSRTKPELYRKRTLRRQGLTRSVRTVKFISRKAESYISDLYVDQMYANRW